MAKKKQEPMSYLGSKGEGDAEDVDRFVSGMLRREGPDLYNHCYDSAVKLRAQGVSDDETKSQLIIPIPKETDRGNAIYTKHLAQNDAYRKEKAIITREAVEDALTNRPKSYQER